MRSSKRISQIQQIEEEAEVEKDNSKTINQNDTDPILPFSVKFDKKDSPTGKEINIYPNSQAKGFYGNIRYVKARSTRIFFFELSLSPDETDFPSYYTIIVIVPGNFTNDQSMPNFAKVKATMNICEIFKKTNKKFVNEYTQEAIKFVNLAIKHVNSQNPNNPDAWGDEITDEEPIQMAIVFNQFDFGLGQAQMTGFPVGKIDFTMANLIGGRNKNKKIRKKNRNSNKNSNKNKKISKRNTKRRGTRRTKTIKKN